MATATVDRNGSHKANGDGRPHLAEMLRPPLSRRRIEATYDAARDTDEFKNYWANADSLDADSANSRFVRSKLVPRARYETANNGYVDGIVQTYANYLVGTGPQLRVQAQNTVFNQFVESIWRSWAKETQLRRKLWCMCHAKVQDGESFALIVTNNGLRHPVKMDLKLIETEQCQTPTRPLFEPGYIDGVKFDANGNVEWYDILPQHPGATNSFSGAGFQQPMRVRPEDVLHWFMLRRAGQHRGVPELRSTLNTGASSRRFREATVAAAETAAELNVLLKTQLTPDASTDPVAPMSTLPIEKRMMTALPMGWEGMHMRSEHPNGTYPEFIRQQLNETARPKSMPYNVAACDSSDYNYASGRLDHQTFFSEINVEREEGNDLVMDRLFARWWLEAVLVFNINSPDPTRPPLHSWDWPKHPVADLRAEALATDIKLKNGTMSLSRAFSDCGLDFEDELIQMATDFGVAPDEMRGILLRTLYSGAAQSQPATAGDDNEQDD